MPETYWVITEAKDWPMLMVMLGMAGFLIGVIQCLVALLVRSYNKSMLATIETNHQAVMDRISTQRKADSDHCNDCQENHDKRKTDFLGTLLRELDGLWENSIAYGKELKVHPLTSKDVKGFERDGG